MNEIAEQHLAEPGLVVFDVTGADEDTVRAAVDAPGRLYAISGPGRLRRVPGQAGVRVRVYANLLRPGGRP
ncbi:DUF6207 family protein [Streptomyces virginiae]|uniref:DUF6207 family protein n=1 Tax=Streptomyces virginiae TaxID=1961 RepID=UPI0032456824